VKPAAGGYFRGVTTAPDRFAGRYRLGAALGAGGMGRVWLAHDDVLQRDVAVKEIVLPADLPDHERDSMQRRTLREARAAARLSHPNVVQVYDVISADGRVWIVMEHVPSRSLQEVIRTEGPLEPRRVAGIGLAVLAALDAAHRAGVRHRDVKPANVLLADDGRVLLTDFGIATIEGDSIVTSSDLVLGSPQYMAPERVRHGHALAASDLWSLGATLYAAVEGRSPYERPSAMATLTALAVEEPDPPRRAGPLRSVLDGLLRRDPAARIDAAEAERRLRAAAGVVPARERPRPLGWMRPVAAGTASPVVPRQRRPEQPAPPAAAPAPPDAARATPAGRARAVPAEKAPAEQAAPAEETAPAERVAPVQAAVPAGPAEDAPPRVPQSEAPRPLEPKTAPSRRRRALVIAAAGAVVAAAVAAWLAIAPGATDQDRNATRPTATPSTGSPPSGSSAEGGGGSTVAPPWGPPAGGTTGGVTGSATGGTNGGTNGGTGTARPLPALPPGWRDYHDPTGFRVYVPVGWTKSQKGSIVYFRNYRTGRVLGIDQTDKPQWNPVADWRGKADYRVGRGDFPRYHEIRIVAVPYFRKAADWEYTFDGTSARQHVNNRGFVVSSHQAYGIYWQTRDADWAAARKDLQLVFDSFRPAKG
jgi:eukaryotic-like serine/threonine-protein kinase